jgi:hypothetical protein
VELEFVMTYRCRTADPLSTEGSPLGGRQAWTVNEATMEGPHIRATLATPGGDWMGDSPDGWWRPDVRLQMRTDDGAIVLVHHTGVVEQTERFAAAAEADQETRWEDQHMRLSLQFDTGSPRYAWLTQGVFVARGRLLGTGHIEYEVFRVS